MEVIPEDQHSQHAPEENINAYKSMRGRIATYRAGSDPTTYCSTSTYSSWDGKQISNFSTKENEKFYEFWEEYMEAINACPHHGFDTWILVSYFYDDMSSSMKQLLETMCEGDFMSKNLEEAMDFLSYVAEVSRGWDEPNARKVGRMNYQPNASNAKDGMYTLNEDTDTKAKFAAMARRLEELKLKRL
ncbi:hypothetical protein AAG906_037826 [Vitis piasezkii]